jgi:hypothetical protein
MRMFVTALALVACGGAALAATPHVDDFLNDEMEWDGGGVPEWQENGGPLGMGDGYLSVPNGSNLAANNTRSDWIGDYTAIDAETISVDMKNEPGSDTLHMRLVLFGPGASPQSATRWTSTVAAVIPADGVWRNYTFSLEESELTRILGASSYQSTITNIVQVMLRHNTVIPPSGGGESVSATLGIDNVRLAAAPSPGDYNRDGEVDLDDYHTWRGSFGTTDSAADGNLSGTVDAADYVFWRDRASSPVELALAIPEPATLPLVGLAAYCALLLKRTRFASRA